MPEDATVPPTLAIPADARPWDVIRASLPEGWGMLLYCEAAAEPGLPLTVRGCRIDPLDRDGAPFQSTGSFSLTFEPTQVVEADLDEWPEWLRGIIERRRAPRLWSFMRV